MCCYTFLDHIIYMEVQMRNKCWVSTSQTIYNAFYRKYPVTFLISEVHYLCDKFILAHHQ